MVPSGCIVCCFLVWELKFFANVVGMYISEWYAISTKKLFDLNQYDEMKKKIMYE